MTPHQQTEYVAWHAVCQEARELGIDVNENGDALTRAIQRWAEELVALTLSHPTGPQSHQNRLQSARDRYPDVEAQARRFRERPAAPDPDQADRLARLRVEAWTFDDLVSYAVGSVTEEYRYHPDRFAEDQHLLEEA